MTEQFEFFSGYVREGEDWDAVRRFASDISMLRNYGMDRLFTVEDPSVVADPVDILVVENQERTNSCVGQGTSSALEYLYWLKTGHKLQLSQNFAYTESQKIAGIRGDNGSQVAAAIRMARSIGCCMAELWPFRGVYDTKKPAGCDEDAKRFRIETASEIRSKVDDQIYLGRKAGPLLCGFPWTEQLSNAGPVLETFDSRSRLLGFHCVTYPFLSPRTDNNGDHYAWMLNSHSTRWANRGWVEVSPTFRQQLMDYTYRGQRASEVWGISDMIEPRPRVISHVPI